jgi:O-succinylhomoserine sulfhydrylase
MKKTLSNPGQLAQSTLLVRGGTQRSPFDETSEGLFMTSGYVYGSAEEAEQAFKQEIDRFVYSRYANPTVGMFEQRLALLEGVGHCRGTASGMAAVYGALASVCSAGDRLVAARALFGSCYIICNEILPRFGVDIEFVDGTDLAQWERALSKPTKCVFLESPSNPCLDIVDIEAVSRLAHAAGATVVVDNVFATPVLQKPFTLGADIVIYSATKHIDGQGRCMGGAILSDDETFVVDHLVPFLRHTGPAISPFNAWLLLKGLETIELRVTRHCQNARAVAEYLEGRGDLPRVIYPGLGSHPQHDLAKKQMSDGGTIVTLDLPGDGMAGREAAFRFLNALEIIDISNNLGDAKTLATHPATTTHQRFTAEERETTGIVEGTVRISIGLEDAGDLIADIERALAIAV